MCPLVRGLRDGVRLSDIFTDILRYVLTFIPKRLKIMHLFLIHIRVLNYYLRFYKILRTDFRGFPLYFGLHDHKKS